MRLIWTLFIPTLVASDASSTNTTKTNSIEKNNNESILPHHLNVEPEERGNVREILKAFDALPEEIAVFEQAMARSATEAEEVATNEKAVNRMSDDEEAQSIMLKLWSGYKEQYRLPPELPPLNLLFRELQHQFKATFLEFVRKDSKREEEWMKWQNYQSGKNKAAEEEIPAVTPTTVQATTETVKVLSDKEAASIIRNLWMEFKQKSSLPDLAGHLASVSSRNMIKSEFSKFLAEDPGRQARFKEWVNWHNAKQEINKALPDKIAAIRQAMTHATKEDAKTDFDEHIALEMWMKFKQKHQLQELLDSPHLEPTTQQKIQDEFLKFVANDKEWMNRRNTEADSNKAGLAQEIPAFSPAVVHATAETEKTFSDTEAEEAMQKLWNKFQLNYVRERKHVAPTFNDLKPESRKKLMPLFLKFVAIDLDRKRMLEGWLEWQRQTGKNADLAREIHASLAQSAQTPTKKRKVIG